MKRGAVVWVSTLLAGSLFAFLDISPATGTLVEHPELSLKLAEGFDITLFADQDLANDIQVITLDDAGRVTVSSRGYIRILEDTDGDGRANRAHPFAHFPTHGAMGLEWVGRTLYVVGDDRIARLRDNNGDLLADGPAETLLQIPATGEHHAHAIRRGADGWFYLIAGDQTGLSKRQWSASSPVRSPIGGALMRFSPDFRTSEVLAHGFRNPYAFDFTTEGELLTFDSDNERCQGLPWYEGCRLYHVIPGMHHGWFNPERAETWRKPSESLDTVPPLADLGRGSPTGVVWIDHPAWPSPWNRGVLLLDWTFGRLEFVGLEPEGSSYRVTGRAVLAEPMGSAGFAPTAAALDRRTGDLFIAIGGRGTRGSIFRIRPRADSPSDAPTASRTRSAPLPLVSEALPTDLKTVAPEDESERDRILRRTLMAWACRPQVPLQVVRDACAAGLDHPDRYVRWAASRLARRIPRNSTPQPKTDAGALALAWGLIGDLGVSDAEANRQAIETAAQVFRKSDDPETRLQAVFLAQRCLVDFPHPSQRTQLFEGYAGPGKGIAGGAGTTRSLQELVAAYPTGDDRLDAELLRLAALLGQPPASDPKFLERLAASWSEASDPRADFHRLIVLARIPSDQWNDSISRRAAEALLTLDAKLEQQGLIRDRHWPSRYRQLATELVRRHPPLLTALVESPSLGEPVHSFLAQSPDLERLRPPLAKLYLAKSTAIPAEAWTPEMIATLASVDDAQSRRNLLRGLQSQRAVGDAVARELCQAPLAEDIDFLWERLKLSDDPNTLVAVVNALERLVARPDPAEMSNILTAYRRLAGDRSYASVRKGLDSWLQRLASSGNAGRGGGTASPGLPAGARSDEGYGIATWETWYANHFPDHANRLAGPDGVDWNAWRTKLAKIAWNQGSVASGREVFTRLGCGYCHAGARAQGPDLAGIGQRFSREDLFRAIIEPSRDVAERYRALVVEMEDGSVERGIVVYEAEDGLILLTAADRSVRLDPKQIVRREISDRSVMPAGLLDRLADEEIRDLGAYLQSLKPGS